MLDIFSTPDGLKRAILALLIQLSKVDGKADLKEYTYIINIARQMGLNDEDVREIAQSNTEYKLKPPADEQSRMTILYYLLFLMDIDGEVTDKEEQLVQEFGFRLGFRTTLTRDLIGLIKKYSYTGVPPHKMLEKIKSYMN